MRGCSRAMSSRQSRSLTYIHVARGSVRVNGLQFNAGDGARVRNEKTLSFSHRDGAEVLLFNLRPNEVNHPTR